MTVAGAAITCPECEGQIQLSEEPHQSEIVECAECRAELEVVATNPVLLALAPEAEEDWGE